MPRKNISIPERELEFLEQLSSKTNQTLVNLTRNAYAVFRVLWIEINDHDSEILIKRPGEDPVKFTMMPLMSIQKIIKK